MDLQIVNASPKHRPAPLVTPPPFGYLYLTASIAPPTARRPVPARSQERPRVLLHVKEAVRELRRLGPVERATVYRTVVAPPPRDFARSSGVKPARFDVAVLVESSNPGDLPAVRDSGPYKELSNILGAAATDVRETPARCAKAIADVDKSLPGLFLFNHFVAEDPALAMELWDHLASWFMDHAGVDNSTVLEPLEPGEADFAFVNHARLKGPLPYYALRQFATPSFRSFVTGNLLANRTGAMPVLCRAV
ncbi:hypothetical protein G5C51_36115 [Streptomyces sp. A7024]|uniref:Uncharacterized protein n=1 Tax=Streptomyces coryli TaxID=1128680 RepID=A0A6G4UC59_9ACTN|nr:hypothetical protein [Streptomyces coryli]NGN69300.1 hypothetical protein [Streptomyces coryli]